MKISSFSLQVIPLHQLNELHMTEAKCSPLFAFQMTLLLFKIMNSTELVKKMHSLFPNVFGESASDSDVPLFEHLAADKWNGLNCVEESLPQKHWDGENIRDLAGCGCIYLRPKVKQEDICPKVQQEVNVIYIEN